MHYALVMKMKGKFAVFAVILLFMGSASIAGVDNTGIEISDKPVYLSIPLHFSFSTPSVYENDNFSAIDVKEADEILSMPSYPSMPYKSEV
ncbi:MAG: hypothetical protein DRN17_05655, partial [Thermoplasmata archaeon]